MASSIKKFVQKKKLDVKFALAGSGHRLDEEKERPQIKTSPGEDHSESLSHQPPSVASVSAGAAALSRLEDNHHKPTKTKPSVDRQTSQQSSTTTTTTDVTEVEEEDVGMSVHSVTVHMKCPLCNGIETIDDIRTHMTSCLYKEHDVEPLTTSAVIIHTLSHDNKDGRKLCIDTICRYIDNIMSHPDDEKYRKIRLYNKAFQERVAHIEGALMFLEAIEFEKKSLPHEGKDEEFYVLPNQVSCDSLNTYKELLLSTEPVTPSLYHNPQLYEVAGRYNRFELPNSFYNMSLEEIKREQKLKSEAIERESILRTKAMRERDEVRASVRYYKYVVLRIRFPENIILQGVFRPQHKLSDVRQFICDELIDPTLIFNLHHLHQCLNDDKASLAQLGLAPAAVLCLSWKSPVDGDIGCYMNPQLIQNMQQF